MPKRPWKPRGSSPTRTAFPSIRVRRRSPAACLGTPALTTRGLKENDIAKVADFLDRAILAKDDPQALSRIRGEVAEFCKAFPMPH